MIIELNNIVNIKNYFQYINFSIYLKLPFSNLFIQED
jgi:hypothetical protein